MKSVFSFYLRYILFILGFQMVFNIIFLLIYQNLAPDVGIGSKLLALVYGLKLDISMTAYILLFPTLVLVFFSIFRLGVLKTILGIYTFLILLLAVPAYFINLIVYNYWKFPIDRSIFDYISTPGEMVASLPVFRIILFLALIILVIYAFYFQAYRKLVSRSLTTEKTRTWVSAALFLIIIPSLLLPIRGGLNTSPVQTGSVYFHENTFINHAALNPVWNLVYTMIEGDKLTQAANFYPDKEAELIMNGLYVEEKNRAHVLNTDSPNILMILLESFSQPVITELGGDGEAAPNMNGLVSEGIFFSRIYSTGTMTDRAIGAVFGGYPGVPGTCIIYYEAKAQKLPNLNLALKSRGYSSAFLYGGDIDFAHIRSFLVMGGFEDIISDISFPRSIPRSSWGVADHYLFDKLVEVTNQASEPFFHVLMTLSSHTPYDVPMEPVFPGSGDMVKYRNSVYYTDSCLGEFISWAGTQDWWDNTLVILMADHGFRVGDQMAYEPEYFRIPILWLGGALAVSDTIISKYGSQTDLAVTLLNQMGLPAEDFTYGKDLLSADSESFAFFTYPEGVGFINDSSRTAYSLITGDFLFTEGPGKEKIRNTTLAYLQYLLSDFNGL